MLFRSMILYPDHTIGRFSGEMLKTQRNILQQGRLIPFQANHIICSALSDFPHNFFLAVHCIGRHNFPQHQMVLCCKCADHMICFRSLPFTATFPILSHFLRISNAVALVCQQRHIDIWLLGMYYVLTHFQKLEEKFIVWI